MICTPHIKQSHQNINKSITLDETPVWKIMYSNRHIDNNLLTLPAKI